MEFKKYKIKDIGEVVTGFTPSKKEKDLYGFTFPFITPSDITNSKYVNPKRFLSEKSISKKEKKVCSKSSVGVSCIGSDLGKAFFIQKISFTNQQINTITNIKKNFDPEYIYYKMKTLRNYFHRIADGSTMPIINKSKFENLSLDIPSLKNQKKISNILSVLDNKIEINKKIIANLEELSQTLFKHWFVDFEFPDEDGNPYKSSGGEMIDSELGEMPKNWKVNKLKEFTKKISSGGTPSRKVKDYWEYGEIMWLKTKEVKEKMIVTTEENITDLGLLKSSAKIINENSTVIAMYGATAGQIAYLGCKMATNQACCTIESEYPNFIYNYFVYNANYIKTLSSGSAQQNLNKKIIEDLKLLAPNLKVLNHYESSVNSNTSLIKSLTLSNLKLQELRDTLLPKLMSGEIEIPDDIEVNTDELSF